MSKSTIKKFAVGTAIAAVAGYLAGILTAPKSGKETRDDVKDAAAKGITEAEKQLKRLHTELNDLIEQTKEKTGDISEKTRDQLHDLLDGAKDSKEKVREVLSALHEGDAQDRELKKAMAEANKAIEHLRRYLAK